MKKTYAERKLESIETNDLAKTHAEEILKKLKHELEKVDKINAVVLYGSYARGDFSARHSDLDIMVFLDVKEKDPALEERILKRINVISLGKMVSVHAVFQYKSVKEEDSSLMLTISKEGKTLYAKKAIVISDKVLGLKPYNIVVFDSTGVDQINKNKLNRFLHGYKIGAKSYKGLINNDKVIAAGKGAIILPEEMAEKIVIFAESLGIKAKLAGKFYR